MHFQDIHDLDPTRAHRVFDVDVLRLAKVYAKALLNAALKVHPNQVDALQESFDSLVGNPLVQDPAQNNAARLLAHGDIPRSKRKAAIVRAMSGKAEEMFINFLLVLDKHGRLHILRPVAAMYREVRDEYHRRVRVVVRTAEPLPNDQKAALTTLAETFLKLQPVLVEVIDPELLGGIQVQVGDKLIDLSVRGRLDAIKNQLIERGTHEIQRRRDRLGPTV
jgi:F-type H+-transporting ATPase subunit delta